MKCPACNADGAYVGLSSVECQNQACRHAVERDPVEEILADKRRLVLVLRSTLAPAVVERIKAEFARAVSRANGWSPALFEGRPLHVEDLRLPRSAGWVELGSLR
jgi:hypothetical protein